jgi:hypothetical protein
LDTLGLDTCTHNQLSHSVDNIISDLDSLS